MSQDIRAFSSGMKSASALIYTGDCKLSHVSVRTNGSNDATVIIYDNTSATGKVVWSQTVTGADHIGGRNWHFAVKCHTGVYAVITGTGAEYLVEWVS